MTTGLDVLNAAAATLQLAQELGKLLKAYHNAPASIKSLATRLSDDVSLLTQLQAILQQAYPSPNDAAGRTPLDEYEHIQKILLYIDPLLQESKTKVEKLIGGKNIGVVERAKWLILGSDLEKAEKELYDWSKRLNLRLTLLPHNLKVILTNSNAGKGNVSPFCGLKAQTQMEELQDKFVQLATISTIDPNAELTREDIPLQSLTEARSIVKRDGKPYLVELKRVAEGFANDPKAMSWVKEELYKLSAVLRAADPRDMHVLKSKGFVEYSLDPRNCVFGLVYSLPPGHNAEYRYSTSQVSSDSFDPELPTTLRQVLSAKSDKGSRLIAQHSLGQRFKLARQIATSVFYCHSIGWVHKCINSSNIFIFSETNETVKFPQTIGTAFLAGFEYSRRDADRSTGLVGVDDPKYWMTQIYQHPERQADQANTVDIETRYAYRHDLYSLGVVLLEVARWKSFEAYAELFRYKSATERQSEMVKMARRIGVVIGDRYARVVLRCLGDDQLPKRDWQRGDEIKEILAEFEDLSSALA
jgi:serine/threonine protein kinase